MSNLSFTGGFEPKFRLGGSAPPSSNTYDIASNNGEIGLFDLVERRADGLIWQAQVTSTTIIGVAAEHKKASAGGTIEVYDDPNIIYLAQISVLAETDMDLLFNITVGSISSLGRSGMSIDGSSKAATATLPIKILRLASLITKEGNVFGNNCKVECMINQGILHAGNLG